MSSLLIHKGVNILIENFKLAFLLFESKEIKILDSASAVSSIFKDLLSRSRWWDSAAKSLLMTDHIKKKQSNHRVLVAFILPGWTPGKQAQGGWILKKNNT